MRNISPKNRSRRTLFRCDNLPRQSFRRGLPEVFFGNCAMTLASAGCGSIRTRPGSRSTHRIVDDSRRAVAIRRYSAGFAMVIPAVRAGLATPSLRAGSGLCSCCIREGRPGRRRRRRTRCPDVPRSRLSVSGRLEPRCNGRRLRDATDGARSGLHELKDFSGIYDAVGGGA